MNSTAITALVAIFIICSSEAHGDACSDRAVAKKFPHFPRIHNPKIAQSLPCTVRLSFDLSVDGVVSNVALINDSEACTGYFYRSVEKSLMKTKFGSGTDEAACTYEFTFRLE